MRKSKIFVNKADLEACRKTIRSNLEESLQQLKKVLESNDCVAAFDACKYDKIVRDPLSGKAENLIEMINQHQTYLVTLKAVAYLLERYPEKTFAAAFGNVAGFDIVSEDKTILAECFAAVSYRNNRKLDKDLHKLEREGGNAACYEFFYDRAFDDEKYALYKEKYPKIHIVKFESLA